jgi:predicted nucleic acid-binding protein
VTIVDTAVWAGHFNGVQDPYTGRLDQILKEEADLAVLPVIVTEVLQGFRSERGFRRARDVLLALPVLLPSIETHVEAARLFRSLRRRGISVRGAIDCIIAQACMDHGAELLSPDADFGRIADHTSLRLWRG